MGSDRPHAPYYNKTMKRSNQLFTRRIVLTLPAWVLVLLVLSSCRPALMEEEIVAPPAAPTEVAGLEVQAVPADITLTRADLPAGFQMAGEQHKGVEYAAFYLRPAALDQGASGGNSLLSVLTTVAVYTTTLEAQSAYRQTSNELTEQAIGDIQERVGEVSDIVIQSVGGAPEGTDASEVYRVSYRLMDQNVFEYGYRLRMGNVLAHVVVTALGNPDEPGHLHGDARDLVQRQMDRISGAAREAGGD